MTGCPVTRAIGTELTRQLSNSEKNATGTDLAQSPHKDYHNGPNLNTHLKVLVLVHLENVNVFIVHVSSVTGAVRGLPTHMACTQPQDIAQSYTRQ